jgi:holo-[acyl-carrier protein] synthase
MSAFRGGFVIVGVGIDIVDVVRMEASIRKGSDRFLERVFTPSEQDRAARGPARFSELAALFAAKEAALKALGTGWSEGIAWREIEVVAGEGGGHSLAIAGRAGEIARGLGVRRAHLSLCGGMRMAAAVVVLEGAA